MADEKKVVKGIDIEIFALSLAAHREDNGNMIFDHLASSSEAETEEEAIAEGLKEAQEKWPPSDGWSIDARAKNCLFSFSF